MTSQNGENPAVYKFDGYRLDVAKRLVLGADGEPLPLKAKAFDTLLFLVENPGRVVDRDEILAAVWPNTVVEENNLTQHISALRRLFGEKPDDHRFIATVPGHGYKFVAEVRNGTDPPQTSAPVLDKTHVRSRKWFILLAVGGAASLLILGFFYRNQPTPANGPIKSLAILPFRPLVAGEGNEVLELGLTDTLISSLGGNRSITVRPLSSVRRFNNPDQDPVKAGQELGVEAVLDASLQRFGDRIRVNYRLIRVADGSIVSSGTIDQNFTDIIEVQNIITTKILASLDLPLTGDDLAKLKKRHSKNPEANDYYIRARHNVFKSTSEGIRQGIAFYEQAVTADPTYALAYAGMADAYRTLGFLGFTHTKEAGPKARAFANKALELDASLAEPYIVLGYIKFFYDWDMASAEANLKRAIELDPNNPDAHRGYAHFLSNVGRHDDAIAEIRLANELSPLTLIAQILEGQFLLFAGREEEALNQIKKASDFERDTWTVRYNLGRAYLFRKRYSEAIAELTKAKDLNPLAHFARMYIGVAYAEMGDNKKALEIIDEMQALSKQQIISSYSLAMVYNAVGQKDKALDLLETALHEREVYLTYLKIEKHWDNLRSEPRFINLMKKVSLES